MSTLSLSIGTLSDLELFVTEVQPVNGAAISVNAYVCQSCFFSVLVILVSLVSSIPTGSYIIYTFSSAESSLGPKHRNLMENSHFGQHVSRSLIDVSRFSHIVCL